MIGSESLLDGVDGSVVLEILPIKIKNAERLVIECGLELEAMRENPDNNAAELEVYERTFRARKFQLDYLKKRFEDIQAAAAGRALGQAVGGGVVLRPRSTA